jgi:hypothetical protein
MKLMKLNNAPTDGELQSFISNTFEIKKTIATAKRLTNKKPPSINGKRYRLEFLEEYQNAWHVELFVKNLFNKLTLEDLQRLQFLMNCSALPSRMEIIEFAKRYYRPKNMELDNSSNPIESFKIVKARVDEFSTGIILGLNRLGEVVSNGFEEAMAVTFDDGKVPEIIKGSLRNSYHKIMESGSNLDPCIAARIVTSENGDTWSWIATSVQRKDEKGRGVSLYRFFCTPGNNLEVLLSHLKEVEYSGRRITFGIKDLYYMTNDRIIKAQIKDYKIPIQYQLPKDLCNIMIEAKAKKNIPLILPFDTKCSIFDVQRMAKYLSSNGSSSFAYNVERVDNTDYFAVICPASKEAEVSIRSKTLHMCTPKINAEQIDLQKISRTIEHLVNNDTMNSKMISNFQEIYQKLIVEKNSEYYLQLENIF